MVHFLLVGFACRVAGWGSFLWIPPAIAGPGHHGHRPAPPQLRPLSDRSTAGYAHTRKVPVWGTLSMLVGRAQLHLGNLAWPQGS